MIMHLNKITFNNGDMNAHFVRNKTTEVYDISKIIKLSAHFRIINTLYI